MDEELLKCLIPIKESLDFLYKEGDEDNQNLFNRSISNGFSERCIAFRFGYYLQNIIGHDFFIDCDFNSSFNDSKQPKNGKNAIENENGKFVDLIVHKRNEIKVDNWFCIEFKKSWSTDNKGFDDDIRKLNELTRKNGEFEYSFGFHIIFGKTLDRTKIDIYQDGSLECNSNYQLLSGYLSTINAN